MEGEESRETPPTSFPPQTLTSLTSCSARLQSARGGRLINSAGAPPVHTNHHQPEPEAHTGSDSATFQHSLTNHSSVGGAAKGVRVKTVTDVKRQ